DEYLMAVAPGYKPVDKASLDILLSTIGATEATRDSCLAEFNCITEDITQTGGARVIGVKLKSGDLNFYSVRIPNSELAVRMWEGGMGTYGHFWLNFCHIARKASVNLPAEHSLHHATVLPAIPTLLRSWERSMGMRSITEGEEKWAISEGTYITLKRTGHPDFVLRMPTKPVAVVQPRLGCL
ncbi:hypothetical protein BC628DRAFT_1322517, partial [Trametes gibbosa]